MIQAKYMIHEKVVIQNRRVILSIKVEYGIKSCLIINNELCREFCIPIRNNSGVADPNFGLLGPAIVFKVLYI